MPSAIAPAHPPGDRTRRITATILLFSLLFSLPCPLPVHAQWAVYDAANYVENFLQALRALYAIYQRIEQIRALVDQVEWMYEQLEGLENPKSRQVATLLYNLGVIIRQGEALVYSLEDLAARYEELFRGWDPSREPREEVREQTRVLLDTTKSVLLSTQRLSRNYVPSQQALGAMKEQLDRAETQAELIQASGLITAWTGEEVSKLLQQTAALTNLLAVDTAYRTNQRAMGEATLEDWLQEGDFANHGNQDGPPVEAIPTLSEWGLALLVGGLLLMAFRRFRGAAGWEVTS